MLPVRLSSLTALLALGLIGIIGPAHAQDPPPSDKPTNSTETIRPEEEKIQIEAMKLYSRVIKQYRDMSAFSSDVDMVLRQGQESINVAFTINLKTPNKVALKAVTKVRGTSRELAIVSNGKDVFQYDIAEKTFTRADAPKDFQAFFDTQDLPVFGLRMVYMPEKTAKDMAEGLDDPALIPAVKKAAIGIHLTQLRLGPEEMLDGKAVLPLIIQPKEMAASGFLLTLYIGKDDNLIHQAKAGDTNLSLQEVYKNPKVNPNLPAATFVFTPPKGAKTAPAETAPKDGRPPKEKP